MKRLLLVLAALSVLSCDFPPPRRCHLQTVEVLYLPAHACTKTKITNEGLITYDGFCPEQCRIVTTCMIWCDEVDARKQEAHLPHPTVTTNVGSNSIRCDDRGQLRF